MVFACCVRGCETVAKNGLHSFPSNKIRAEKWILAIKAFHLVDALNENRLSRSYRKVCRKHFLEYDFVPNIDGKSRLTSKSVPSIHLPPDIAVKHASVKPSKVIKPVKRLQHGQLSNVRSKNQPTARSNQPTTGANEPTTEPKQPTAGPNQPTGRPNQPTIEPKQPTARPKQPTTEPNQSTARPNQPTGRPKQPTGRPNQTTSEPRQPTARPNQPTIGANQPTTKPNQPTTEPNQSTARLNQPTAEANQPTTGANQQTTEPNQPTARPIQPTARPNQPTAEPKPPSTELALEEHGNDCEWLEVGQQNLSTVTETLHELGKKSYQDLMIAEKKLQRQVQYLNKRVKDLQQRKKIKINDSSVIKYLSTKLNDTQCEFFKMQLTNHGRTKHGRRYTVKQKSLSLAFYKKGPKLYRFLETVFVLPTKKTIGRHSAKLVFKSGVNQKVLEAIKATVQEWPENDKYCSLGWDEVSVDEHLDYNHSQDFIEGFVELAGPRKPVFATHALTFMVRGFNVSFKETTGYFYTSGLFAFELAELVKLMIGAVSGTGLNPILSICDQVNINASTVNLLINPNGGANKSPGQLLQYSVNGRQMIHVFDPSHLIKTVRNNLETKNISHCITERWRNGDSYTVGTKKTASWDHIWALYETDKKSTQRLLPKLTDEHLAPKKFKMRVSYATQVFSNTCGTVMLHCVEEKKLPAHFANTAQILFFMNDIFDSINGSEKGQEGTLKSAVQADSIHFSFWEYALTMLANMNYVNKSDGKINNRSSVLKKLESTIRGYIAISKTCFELDIPKVSLRDTSQDGLENYFGGVKSCNQSNKPTPREFRTGYATMAINNITGTNSLRSNCERDSSSSILTNIHEFVLTCNKQDFVDINANGVIANAEPETGEDYDGTNNLIVFNPESDIATDLVNSKVLSKTTDVDELIIFDPQFDDVKLNFFEETSISQASTLICQKLLKFNRCVGCKSNLKTNENILLENCTKVIRNLFEIIPHLCTENNLKKKLVGKISPMATDTTFGCQNHELEITQKIKELCVDHTITSFCYDINRLLKGKVDTLPDNCNHMQKLAFQAYDQKRKNKKIGKYSDIFNC